MGRRLSLDRFAERGVEDTARVVEQLRPLARPLATDADLDPLLARIGDARYVLLGEATHGTSEFYTWRERLTRRLIAERGFDFVAVEGDWPDCYRVNRYVKSLPDSGASAVEVLSAFDRWPTWMWANREVAAFAEWLRAHNAGRAEDARAGFYGLDVYSLWDSMRAVTSYLDRVDPAAAGRARRAYECFAPYGEDEHEYARATAMVPTSCEQAVVRALAELRARATALAVDGGREAHFEAEQNALVARNAERYYRAMVRGGPASWNVRDGHMVETLDRLAALHGAGAKAVVWEHNTHVGDARYTDMAADGEFNVGQRVRELHGEDSVVLVGFSTHRGTVVAGDEWGAPMRAMRVPPGREGSYEDVLHRVGADDKLLLVGDAPPTPELLAPRGHRAIGVVYRAQHERFGNYVPTVLPRRYDALLYVDETRALSPLHPVERVDGDAPETWPTGM
ncbi:MAG: erythromycin esterase [Myxococcaceae bacterium]|nr:erythromycin esterase [Myxococcaceae bacterium]